MRKALGLILLIVSAGVAGRYSWPNDPVAQVGVSLMLLAIGGAIWLFVRAQQRDRQHP